MIDETDRVGRGRRKSHGADVDADVDVVMLSIFPWLSRFPPQWVSGFFSLPMLPGIYDFCGRAPNHAMPCRLVCAENAGALTNRLITVLWIAVFKHPFSILARLAL